MIMPNKEEPVASMIIMATQLERATSEPTERSMPAVMMMKVMPTDMMVLMDTCRATLTRLGTVRKDLLARDMARVMTKRTPKEP